MDTLKYESRLSSENDLQFEVVLLSLHVQIQGGMCCVFVSMSMSEHACAHMYVC